MDVVTEVVAEAYDFRAAVEAAATHPLAQGTEVFGSELAEGAEEEGCRHGVIRHFFCGGLSFAKTRESQPRPRFIKHKFSVFFGKNIF